MRRSRAQEDSLAWPLGGSLQAFRWQEFQNQQRAVSCAELAETPVALQ